MESTLNIHLREGQDFMSRVPLYTLELINDGERIQAIGFIKQFELDKWQRRIHSICVENILFPTVTLSFRL